MSARVRFCWLIRGCVLGMVLFGAGALRAEDTEEEPKPAGSFRDLKGSVRAMAFTPDGKTLATAGGGTRSEIVLWDMQTTRRRVGWKDPGTFGALEFSPTANCWRAAGPPRSARTLACRR